MTVISHSLRSLLFPILVLIFSLTAGESEGNMFLIDRLHAAKTGDYIVTAIDNTYTVLIIKDKTEDQISIEEISIPRERLKNPHYNWCGWRKWVEAAAPGNTSWILYTIENPSGKLLRQFSYTKNAWTGNGQADHFLSQLLQLRMVRVPHNDLKRVGPPLPENAKEKRRPWMPQMVYEGKVIPQVSFEAWRTRWPKDSSELSGKMITIYVPEEDARYPSYFPYWLEVKGMLAKAKIRIIDSGRNLCSPRPVPRTEGRAR